MTEEKVSAATKLVALAESLYEFGCASTGEPYAVPLGGPFVARMLRGGRDSLRAELATTYAEKEGRVPPAQALTDALMVIEGRCQRAPRIDLPLRVTRTSGGRLLLDLGDEDGRVVAIDPDGWVIEPASPVLFRRTDLTGALPQPVRGGSLDPLRELLNVTDESWPLLLAYLVAAVIPNLPHPILLVTGEQGAAKTSAGKMLASLVDPSPAQLRCPPRDIESWVVAAAGGWLVGLDNVTTIPEWLSDAMCRAVTGDGMVRRRLYSDSQLSVLSFRRVLLLTAVDPGALRGDLADRLLTVELNLITEEERRDDEDVADAWRAVQPVVLGGLLDLVARVLAELPSVHLARRPRMADFARIVAAVDRVLDTDALSTYRGQGRRLAEDVVDSDPVITAVRQYADSLTEPWQGTGSALLDLLRPERPSKAWPTSARGMAAALARSAPALRAVGVEVAQAPREAHTGRRLWTITRSARVTTSREGPQATVTPSPPSPGERFRRSTALPAGDGSGDGYPQGDGSTVTRTATVTPVYAGSELGDGGDGPPHPLTAHDRDRDYSDEDPWIFTA